MLPSAITKKMLIAWGGKDVYDQAEYLVHKGAVSRAEMRDDLIQGVIAREAATDLHTRLRIKPNGSIESLCPCPSNRHHSLVCPHVVALGITLMLRHSDPLREQKYLEDQRRARRLAEATATTCLKRAPHGTPAQLHLLLATNWVEEFRRNAIRLAVRLRLGDQLLNLADLPPATTVNLSPTDDNLLAVLEDICEGSPPPTTHLTAVDFINLLLIATHNSLFVSGSPTPLTVHTAPITAKLRVDLDHDTGELIVYPHAQLPEMQPGDLPIFLVAGRHGCVLLNHALWPLASVLPLPYHPVYQQDQIVARADVINFLRRDLPQLQKHTPIELELTPDLFSVRPGTPTLRLNVQGSRASLRLTPTASYGTEHFALAAPDTRSEFSLPDPSDILAYHTRNFPVEEEALARLRQLGFTQDGTSMILAGKREVLNFLGSGYPSLVRSGWKVTIANQLLALLDEMPLIVPVVKIEDTRPGWFDVGYTFEVPGQGTVPPAAIQRALNCGDSFLQLGQQTLLLDTDAIESMRAVFSDCPNHESQTPGHFRLPALYAPFVQASLNALDGVDVEDAPDWREKAATRNRATNRTCAPVPLGSLESTLRPYQKEGVYWLAFLENSGLNGVLADEMGLGKTLQTLTWLNLPRSDPQAQGKAALVVCPTSLVENWNREAATFVPHLRRLVISGSERRHLFAKIPENDIIITSYALLRRDLDAYRAFQFSAAILDEAQHIKNRSTQNAVAAKQINAHNKLVLTGTPVENSVADIWSIMDFLMPQYLGEYEEFRLRYELPISLGEEGGNRAQAKLKRKIHPFLLRRLKRDVAKDLPAKIIKTSFCQLTLDQQRVYNDLLAESRRKVKELVGAHGFDKSRFEILALLMRMRQACCHLDLLKHHHAPGTFAEPSAKVEAFFELLDEAMDGGHRILVFSQFVGMLTLLRQELDARAIPYCYLDGATKDRLQQCQRFNLNAEIPLFLISLKAGGTGLNLTGADMVVHFDPWWNPAVEDQATDRAHRIGQKRTVYSIKLIAEHTIEERVLEMQKRKQEIIDATIGTTDRSVMQKLSFEDIRNLIGL